MLRSTGRHALLGFLVSILGPITGCGAIRAGVQIQDAVDARDAAAERGAAESAPYEHTLAERYLQKAWEEMGTGQYKTAVQLAKKSAEWSDQAVIQVQRGHRPLVLDDATLEDAPAETGPAPESNAPPPPLPDPVPIPEGPPPETP